MLDFLPGDLSFFFNGSLCLGSFRFLSCKTLHKRCPPLAEVPKAEVGKEATIPDCLYVNSFMKADKDNFHLYNSQLQPFASSLRKEMTKAEACLWKYVLKARQLRGYPFRRQIGWMVGIGLNHLRPADRSSPPPPAEDSAMNAFRSFKVCWISFQEIFPSFLMEVCV